MDPPLRRHELVSCGCERGRAQRVVRPAVRKERPLVRTAAGGAPEDLRRESLQHHQGSGGVAHAAHAGLSLTIIYCVMLHSTTANV